MIKLKVPIKIVSEFNNFEHWRIKHKRHKMQKLHVAYALRTLSISLPIHVTLTRIAPRKLDGDNLQGGLKWARDAVSEFLIPGKRAGMADSDPLITWHYAQEKGLPKEYALGITFSHNACSEQAQDS